MNLEDYMQHLCEDISYNCPQKCGRPLKSLEDGQYLYLNCKNTVRAVSCAPAQSKEIKLMIYCTLESLLIILYLREKIILCLITLVKLLKKLKKNKKIESSTI